jgi:hypothetical protein
MTDEMTEAEHDDEVGEILRDIDELMMAGYSYEEARYRLGYNLRQERPKA